MSTDDQFSQANSIAAAMLKAARALEELAVAFADAGESAGSFPVSRQRRRPRPAYKPSGPVSDTDKQAARELLRRTGVLEVKS